MNGLRHHSTYDVFAEARNELEVDNLLNTDVYKLLMLDFVLAHPEYRDIQVKWKMHIRTPGIRTADVIPREALINQLQGTKDINGVSDANLSFLGGMKQKSEKPLFRDETLKYMKSYQLSDFAVGVDENRNYTMEFSGSWADSILWEIYGLKIINSLYMYYYVKKAKLTSSEFSQIITTALHRLFTDIETYKTQPDLTVAEGGTRRSLSTSYHRHVVEIISERLKNQFVGTSNVLFSNEMGHFNPKGTNAHELRMIPVALHDDAQKIIDTMYAIDRQWGEHYPDLGILLPDTFGSSFYYKHCPDDIAEKHIGSRFDSKDPHLAIPEYEAFLRSRNIDPQTKMGICSDGLDADTCVDTFPAHRHRLGKLSFGPGTSFSNNTKGTRPRSSLPFGPFGSFSVVIKPYEIQRPSGLRVPCVKLTDNPLKGFRKDTQRFKDLEKVFGTEGFEQQEVLV